jgi:hypothetical protein
MAATTAACGAAVSEVSNPEAKLRNMAEKVGLDGFASQLNLLIQRRYVRTEPATSADDSPADTILDITEIAVLLDGDSPEGGVTCKPRLSVTSHWKAINAADGRELEQGVSRSYAARSTKSFKEWFDDDAAIAQDIRSLLENLAEEVTYDLLIGRQRH